ncbi:hypothetical protein BWD08_01300 [Neisseria animaloris]|nr:hypothetical protein BWD08_01300 [Neisseria animaloris]
MVFFINLEEEDVLMKKFIALLTTAALSATVMAAPVEKAATSKVEEKVTGSQSAKSAKKTKNSTKAATGTATTGAATVTPLDASGVGAASGVVK